MFEMDAAMIRSRLSRARRAEPGMAAQVGVEIELPMPDGSMARFKIVDAPVMAPELAAEFPEIKTYAGQGIDDPAATIRLDLTPAGLHAQVLSPQGAVYVDPAYRGDARYYISYFKRDLMPKLDGWRCFVKEAGVGRRDAAVAGSVGTGEAKTQSGGTLRTYRLAVAATGEYTAFHSPPAAPNVAAGQAAIVTAINRVNGVFETELAVRLVLVANNSLLVYTNSATDPYSNVSDDATLETNQLNIDAVIGSANYDLGHVFCTDFGGYAQTPSICLPGEKARGSTGQENPVGDAFWIDFVAHEMGHQFGANHTFNSETGSCGGARNPDTAFEPGSGSTIMAYAGLCFPNDLQVNSHPYFHAGSLDEIQSTISNYGTCASNSPTGNSAPAVNAGADYVIPASTPFVLTAMGSDPNSEPVTYCWEQMDVGAAAELGSPDDGTVPLFRSLLPTNSPVRYFPRLPSVLAGTNWNQEQLPATSRTMGFRVTARDNRPGGGGVADDDMQVTVVGGAGPFVVTSPNTAVAWSGYRKVTWNVAGTTASPINASGVDIHLSTNGGGTFNITLASNLANTGSAVVLLPELNSSQARIRVQGSGNIFYDVSDADFTIAPLGAGPLLVSEGVTLSGEACFPTNGLIDPYETVTIDWALWNAGPGPTTNLVGTLLSTNGVYCISNGVYVPASSQTYGVIPAGGGASRSFSFVPAAVCGGLVTGALHVADGAPPVATFSHALGVGLSQALVTTQVFANTASISVNDSSPATPYPSTLSVTDVTNSIFKLTATLTGLTHFYVADVGVILAGPGGQTVALMDTCGDGASAADVDLVFDDDAAASLPEFGGFGSGTYRPTNYGPPGSYPSPAPEYPYGTSLNALAGAPNGTWSLYVVDWADDDDGSIAGGWQISLLSSNSPAECCSALPPAGPATAGYSNGLVSLTWQSLPGVHYQVQYRTNLVLGSWQSFSDPMAGTGVILSTNDFISGGPARFYRIQVLP
jgi:subtilisin-like proprotein convertase family protein